MVPDPAPAGWSGQQVRRACLSANRELVDRKEVRLVFDTRRIDRTGALLAYVYRGETFVNAELIESGFALVEADPQNDRFTRYFQKLLRKAKKARAGLWAASSSLDKPESQPIRKSGPPPWQKKRPAGKMVYTQPGGKYYYFHGDPRIRPDARRMLIEDARQQGFLPAPPTTRR
jgi:micrococcal nuclease